MEATIVSFNIRSFNPADGINMFVGRRGLVRETIQQKKPDIICFQEVLPDMLKALREDLPEYDFAGGGRGVGFVEEHNPIAYRRNRFTLASLEMFWLSEEPYRPGSRYQGQSICPRIGTCALLKDQDSGEIFRVLNTHLDHEGSEARVKGAKQLREYIRKLAMDEKVCYGAVPIFLAGDFNAGPDEPELLLLREDAGLRELTEKLGGTFHEFGKIADPEKIDYIFASPEVKGLDCGMWTEERDGVYLSDHYPVWATFSFSQADWITQPFESGSLDSLCYRIPSLMTTRHNTLLAAADVRWNHGMDSAGNLETAVARSVDNGHTWERSLVNHFDDVVDGTDRCIFSAGFIDPVMAQDSHGKIYLLADLCPAFVGTFPVNGIVLGQQNGRHANGHLALKDWESSDKGENTVLDETTYPYYAGERDTFGYKKVLRVADDSWYEGYLLDAENYLYQWTDGYKQPVMIPQLNGQGEPTARKIHANIFYAASPIKAYPTFHIACRISEDDGKTFGPMQLVDDQVAMQGFTGICPGRGLSYWYQGKERVMFPIYDNNLGAEYASVIYTEDGGVTWKRGSRATQTGILSNGDVIKCSESQLVTLRNRTLRMYSRNIVDQITYSDSTDGGETWAPHKADPGLAYCANCMVSVIRYSAEIEGRTVYLASYPQGDGKLYNRVNGVIAVGLEDAQTGQVEWRYHYPVNHSAFYYSCLTELADGTIGLLYEYADAAIRFQVYRLEELMRGENEEHGTDL